MGTIRRILAVLTWSGLATLVGVVYFQPRMIDCASHAHALSTSADFFYSPWHGCQVETEPGTWASWNDLRMRSLQLPDVPACEGRGATRCA
ncbi:MAG: hypothetical protein AB7G75_12710 [Candidatus Binatia bacterium]